jgi:hypothetical protein
LCHTLLYKEASATGYTCGSHPQDTIETMNTAPTGSTKVFKEVTIGPNDHEHKQPQETSPATYEGGGLEPNDSSEAAANGDDGKGGASSDGTKAEQNDGEKKDDGNGANVPAIVGGVVGGVAAIGLGVLAVALFFLRRRKAKAAGPRSISREGISYPIQPPGSEGPALWEEERFGIRDTKHTVPMGYVMSPIAKIPKSGDGYGGMGVRAIGYDERRVSGEIAELPASPLDR